MHQERTRLHFVWRTFPPGSGRTRSAARLPHLEWSPRGLNPEPGLPNQCCTGNNAGTLMKCKLLRFHLHRAGIKQATSEQGSQVSQVPANPFPHSSAQLGRCSKEQELKASCIFPPEAYKREGGKNSTR